MEPKIPAQNPTLDDLLERRLRSWYDQVPEDLRRLIYEYWSIIKRTDVLRKYRFDKSNWITVGKYKKLPDVEDEEERRLWIDYSKTYSTGEKRLNTLKSIVMGAKLDINKIKEKVREYYGEINVISVFISGSVIVGPRDLDTNPDTDIDLYIVVDKPTQKYNNIYFKTENQDRKYQLFVVGPRAEDVPSFMAFNPIVFPRIDIFYSNSDEETMKGITANLLSEYSSDQEKARLKEAIETLKRRYDYFRSIEYVEK